MQSELLESLKQRYSHVHPLIFHRSVERAKSAGDLFDILDTTPEIHPIKWDDEKHRWVTTDDLFQAASFTK